MLQADTEDSSHFPCPPARRRALGFGFLPGIPRSSARKNSGEAHGGAVSEPEQEPSEVLAKGEKASSWFRSSASGTYQRGARGDQGEGPTRNDFAPLPRAKNGTEGVSNGQEGATTYSPLVVFDSFLLWFDLLHVQYGTKLLLLLHSSQHVLKGIVHQFQAAAVMWLLREYQVSGPQMQVYLSIAGSAWALKPVLGCMSDMIPVAGYRKAPYVLLTSIAGVACTTTIGFSCRDTIGPLGIVACLFGMALQAATCDLLTEAKYSEQLQEKPAFGPDLISYVWGGISVGSMIAIAAVGWIIDQLGPRAVFLACIAPSAAIILPTVLNYFEEVQLSKEMASTLRNTFLQQTEVIYLCFLMSGCSMGLSAVGVLAESHTTHCIAALCVMAIMLPSFHIILRPEIAKVNTFFALQACFGVTISGATFYFYTDQSAQYAEGPHFSIQFFASALGLVASAMSLLGLAVYTKYMKDWSFRSLLLFSNVVVTVLSLLDAVMFVRLNVRLGIPDTAFILGSSVSTVVIRQWQWMPGIVIMSQLCPVGMEATMFALLAGCANVGSQVSDYLGSFILDWLEVHPTGALGEGHQFDNLWKASILATVLPGLTIFLIPFMIPQAKQTDSKLLIGNCASATWGSPLWRWRQEFRSDVNI